MLIYALPRLTPKFPVLISIVIAVQLCGLTRNYHWESSKTVSAVEKLFASVRLELIELISVKSSNMSALIYLSYNKKLLRNYCILFMSHDNYIMSNPNDQSKEF